MLCCAAQETALEDGRYEEAARLRDEFKASWGWMMWDAATVAQGSPACSWYCLPCRSTLQTLTMPCCPPPRRCHCRRFARRSSCPARFRRSEAGGLPQNSILRERARLWTPLPQPPRTPGHRQAHSVLNMHQSPAHHAQAPTAPRRDNLVGPSEPRPPHSLPTACPVSHLPTNPHRNDLNASTAPPARPAAAPPRAHRAPLCLPVSTALRLPALAGRLQDTHDTSVCMLTLTSFRRGSGPEAAVLAALGLLLPTLLHCVLL